MPPMPTPAVLRFATCCPWPPKPLWWWLLLKPLFGDCAGIEWLYDW